MLLARLRSSAAGGCVTAPTLPSSRRAPRARAARARLGTPMLAWACTWACKVMVNGEFQNSLLFQQFLFLDLSSAQGLRRRPQTGVSSSAKRGAGSEGMKGTGLRGGRGTFKQVSEHRGFEGWFLCWGAYVCSSVGYAAAGRWGLSRIGQAGVRAVQLSCTNPNGALVAASLFRRVLQAGGCAPALSSRHTASLRVSEGLLSHALVGSL